MVRSLLLASVILIRSSNTYAKNSTWDNIVFFRAMLKSNFSDDQKVKLKCLQNGEKIIDQKLKIRGSYLISPEGAFMLHLSTDTTCTVKGAE